MKCPAFPSCLLFLIISFFKFEPNNAAVLGYLRNRFIQSGLYQYSNIAFHQVLSRDMLAVLNSSSQESESDVESGHIMSELNTLIENIESNLTEVVESSVECSNAVLNSCIGLEKGDVLMNTAGEIFFFMAAMDDTKCAVTRASNSMCDKNQPISKFILKLKYNKDSVRYLDYSNVHPVYDNFKVIQEFGGYLLLGSTCHSIVFVAPAEGIDQYIRVEFQKITKSTGALKPTFKVPLAAEEEQKTVPSKVISLPRAKRSVSFSDEMNYSPDSVAFCSRQNPIISRIETLFRVSSQASSADRFDYIFKILRLNLLEGLLLSVDDAMVIVKSAEALLKDSRLVEYIDLKEGQTISVVGDIHGQFCDLLRFFDKLGWPSEQNKYLFNGDIVDRGSQSIECVLLIYALKIAFPQSIFINRGNHESEMCGPGLFRKDSLLFDESEEFYRACHDSFLMLPYAHVISDRVYVVHGGVRSDFLIKDFVEMDRSIPNGRLEEFANTSMWDDSSEDLGYSENSARGPCSQQFGPDVTLAFLTMNGFDQLIRSHTMVQDGIVASQEGRCWTLFSAPNYCGRMNRAAIVQFNDSLEPLFCYFEAKK